MKKGKEKKEEKDNKFIQSIKKKWLLDGVMTFLLVAVVIAVYIAINTIIHNQNWTPIDLSQEKLYTLTDESKEKVKNIEKDVNIYFVNFEEEDSTVTLTKQYTNVNNKINVEIVNESTRPDFMEEYELQSGEQGIIVKCGEKMKALSTSELITYDTTSNKTISIAEQKLTNAIMTVTQNSVPKVYFLNGYSNFTLNSGMYVLNMYLANEINEIAQLDLLAKGTVPDDCDTLVIPTPSKDFDDIVTDAIIAYINSGRNILWLNSAVTTDTELPNVNKILALYGVAPFQKGYIMETDTDKIVGYSNVIIPSVSPNHNITKDIYKTTGVIFRNATKINMLEQTENNDLKTSKTDLIYTSDKAFFRTDFTQQNTSPVEGEVQEEMLVGAEIQKTISEANEETGEKAKVSKLVIYGENYFASDAQVNTNYQVVFIQLASNKDLILNSISYLVNREEDITVRKDTGAVVYTATEKQNAIVLLIIFIVPLLIIIIGIIVWVKRRRQS